MEKGSVCVESLGLILEGIGHFSVEGIFYFLNLKSLFNCIFIVFRCRKNEPYSFKVELGKFKKTKKNSKKKKKVAT